MKVLIACEYSGIVRDAFAALSHDALSCDILPTESPGQYYQCDVREILDKGWDMMIAHPPCTYLSVSGMHWTKRGLRDPQLTVDALDFVRTLMNANIPKIAIENPVSIISTQIIKPDQIIHPWMFGDDASKKTCLWLKALPKLKVDKSNVIPPKGWELVMAAQEMEECECCQEPFCIKHQEHYADCECVGVHEDEVEQMEVSGIMFGCRNVPVPKLIWGNQTPSGQNKLGPSADRWKIRSKTYAGIADAMAAQWGA